MRFLGLCDYHVKVVMLVLEYCNVLFTTFAINKLQSPTVLFSVGYQVDTITKFDILTRLEMMAEYYKGRIEQLNREVRGIWIITCG